MKKIRSITISVFLAILLSVYSFSFAADAPGGPGGGGPGGGAPGGPGGGGPGIQATINSRIKITDGKRDTASELADSKARLTIDKNGSINDLNAGGIRIETSETGNSGVYVNGDTGKFTLGGPADLYTLDGTGYNSVIKLDDTDVATTTSKYSTELAAGFGYGVKGGTAYLENAYVYTVGPGRPATYAAGKGTMIVKDSYVEAKGGTSSFIPGFKLISGSARANLIMGGSAFFFNTRAKSNDWGALSTDTGGPDPTYLYVYNTYAESTNGGYGTYSDTNCFVYLYGSTLKAGEFGAILSNSGELYADSGANASTIVKEKMDADDKTTTQGSTITGARNAVMVHTVDSMQNADSAALTFKAKLNVKNSTLSTVTDLKSNGDYVNDKKVGASAPFINHHLGSVILFRSGNADVSLDKVQMASSNKTLIHSVPDYDEGGASYPIDGHEALGISVSLKDMNLTGNILHEDFQRKMTLNLSHTTITGKIISGTMAAWNNLWAGYSKDIQAALTHNTTYKSIWGLRMTMDGESRWIVTDTSTLATLTMANGASITAEKGKTLKIYKDCKMDNSRVAYDYITGTETASLEAGKTYNGVVLVIAD